MANALGGLGNGRQTVANAATAAQLSTTSVRANWVTITAETDNTGIIVVGDSTVVASLATRKGHPLTVGASKTFLIHNLQEIYLDTTVNGDGVSYVYGL
jgi:hypothetical protein